jgi:hypothetical protein
MRAHRASTLCSALAVGLWAAGASAADLHPSVGGPSSDGDADETSVVQERATEPALPARAAFGWSENRFFVRTPGDALVLFPGGVVQADSRSLHGDGLDVRDEALHLRRARLEVAGLVQEVVSFNAAVNLAGGPALSGVDDYLAVRLPRWADRLIIQVGQFDAPFTMDNRISDRSLDLLERSMLARVLAVPENKARGMMVHGTNPARNFYYASGVFVGGRQIEGMGRAWLAPLSLLSVPERLRSVTIGGSFRLGHAHDGSLLGAQSTPAGFIFLDPHTRWLDGADTTDVTLRRRGNARAAALELSSPFGNKAGVRFEWAIVRQPLESTSATNGGSPVIHGGMGLRGWASYGELWCWVLGDDRIVGEQGLQIPARLGRLGPPRPLAGVMLVARAEYLDETLAAGADSNAAADVVSAGATRVATVTLDANVWFARRLRATLSYDWNHLSGSSVFLSDLSGSTVHELSLGLSMVL